MVDMNCGRRRLVDVSHVDLSLEIIRDQGPPPRSGAGPSAASGPSIPEGDIAVARATKKKNTLHIMSTQASFPVEAINEARGTPVWYQLYTTNQFEVTKKLVKRAEAAGCPVVAVTVDTPAGRNTETATRLRRDDTRTCSDCHAVDDHGNPRPLISTKPMFAGIDTQGLGLTQGVVDLGLRQASERRDQDESPSEKASSRGRTRR